MRDSAAFHRRWQVGAFLLSAGVMLGAAPLAIPFAYLADRGVSLSSLDWVRRYFTSLPNHPAYWLGAYRQWVVDGFARGQLPASLLLPPALALATLFLAKILNPHDAFNAIHGSARWAGWADLRRMKLFDGFVIVLGQWRQKRLKFGETLSALCIAPPGTGKTVSVVVPTILDAPGVSMVINDVKPELHQVTSGYRARLGPVFKLEWAAIDDPASGLVHARWNPLSPASMPRRGPERDLYVDRLCSILVADPQGGADPHWSRKGRAALAGLTHYIICKAEAGDIAGLPPRWHGAEPSFAMLLDWLTEAVLAAGEAIEALKQSDPNAAFGADPVRDMLMAAVTEARQGDYAHRAILELTQLANTPDRERGSVLSTMDAGLAVFKNEAVRQRTSRSDFTFADLRGMPDARGRMRPVTVYLCVNQQDSRALGVVTGLFVEALSSYLIAHPPGSGRGPFPALFVLDEFPQMPKLQALIDGPAVGRGQKVSYLLIGQDFAQIEEKYGKTGLETLLSTTAAKIVLPLNNEAVAKRFSEMVGQFTHEGESKSRTYGFSKQANPVFGRKLTICSLPPSPPNFYRGAIEKLEGHCGDAVIPSMAKFSQRSEREAGMGIEQTIHRLTDLRAGLCAEGARLQKQVSDLERKQLDIDATLAALGFNSDDKATIREALLGQNDRTTLDVLRRARRYLTSSEIARQVLMHRGLDPDNRSLISAMTKRVRVILRQYQHEGILISRPGKYPHLEWSLA